MYRDEDKEREKITHNELLSSFISKMNSEFFTLEIKKQKSPFFNLTRELFSLYSKKQNAYTKKKAIR